MVVFVLFVHGVIINKLSSDWLILRLIGLGAWLFQPAYRLLVVCMVLAGNIPFYFVFLIIPNI